MGRRKIAIQPITNDRTRSVTFLKRKTGLFKKAYELGVLCSVDVAVIIFERRAGHPDKLFQYCSTDINALVQRQIRFDGERDLRTPQDFSGGANASRMEDIGDEDDDGDADDSPTVPHKRQDTLKGKINPEGGKAVGAKAEAPELDYRLHLPGAPQMPSPTLPVSADRHTQPHASGSRAPVPSPYTAQSPNPHKRAKVDDRQGAATSPVSATFPTYRQESGPPHPSRTFHSHTQPPPPHSFQPPFFSGSGSQMSPTTSGGGLHTSASFPSPGGSSMNPSLHSLPPFASPRHPPRITQPHFTPSADDIFANVFGPAGGSGVGLDLEFDFLAPPLTFDWPQFAPTAQTGSGSGHGNSTGESNPSWLDFLGSAPDALPRSPRSGKRTRGDGGDDEENSHGGGSG